MADKFKVGFGFTGFGGFGFSSHDTSGYYGQGTIAGNSNGFTNKKGSSGGVKSIRAELQHMFDRYQRIADAIEGEHAIKYRKCKYLPLPSECENDKDGRYKAYLTRAVYYNVCQPTRDALVGQLFLKAPVIDLPEGLEFLVEDVDGDGSTFDQLARKAANYVLPFGRGGFLTDFPETKGEVTKGEIESGEVRPIIRFFEPWAIRNWKVEKVGTIKKLTMLVLDEQYEDSLNEDEFQVECTIRHRVYRLVKSSEGVYCCSVQIYNSSGESVEKYDICGADGLPLDGIPFDVVGSLNNDMEVDEPPFTNLANLNIAHYRNSADYEESAYLVGQPTPVYTGLTEDWVDNYFKHGVPFGSRASIPLPEKADAKLLQAEPNTLAFEAMTHKEDQMFSIGAKIIDRGQKVEKKEKEVENETASQKSVLKSIRDNLQMALKASIKRAGAFVGIEVTDENMKFELNENFDLGAIGPDDIRLSSELYQKGDITFSEHRSNLLRSSIATESDEDEVKKSLMEDKKLKESLMPPQPEPTVGTGTAPAKKKPQKASSPDAT